MDDAGAERAGIGDAGRLITACICTHNRPDYLRDCLDGLRAQSARPDEFDVLVVDSGSSADQAARIAALVTQMPRARLLRVERPGLSLARNAAARAVQVGFIAYLDDDAIPTVDWIATIRAVIGATQDPPALLGGAIRPVWEAPLPAWWPAGLVGVLSIIEAEGAGEYRYPGAAQALEPYGANMIVHVPAILAVGGFIEAIGRTGKSLLSDEEKVLAWRLQDTGRSVRYDSRIVVHHQIQAERLTVGWLLSRLYWQGMSRVRSARRTAPQTGLFGEAARRAIVFVMLAPVALVPTTNAWLIGLRWRWFYAYGFLRAFLTDRPARDGASEYTLSEAGGPPGLATTEPAAPMTAAANRFATAKAL